VNIVKAARIIPVLLLISILLSTGQMTYSAGTPTPVPQRGLPSGGLHVQGNQIVDGNGQPFLLRGAVIESGFNNAKVKEGPDSELFQATQHLTNTTFSVMHQQWNMNAVRLPLSNWLWQDDPEGYLDRVESVVKQANDAQLIVILALDSSRNAGSPYPKTETKMPMAEAADFWKSTAARFKDNPNVMFDLFNEPNMNGDSGDTKAPTSKTRLPTDAEWDFWATGGTKNGQAYIGMQNLVDAIRGTGALQVIVASGMGGVLFRNAARHALKDSLKDGNIIYAVHVYFGEYNHTTDQWNSSFGFMAQRYPIYVSEWAFLPNGDYKEFCKHVEYDAAPAKVQEFMKYMDTRKISWTAYSFALNRLIQDYSSYAPTQLDIPWECGDRKTKAGMGTLVKQFLTGGQ
jgi:hypothetical protein